MASAAISSDLQSLLPTLVGPIPSELVNLATSLLAQSRSRISNLKPTEEVARNYVCAHLACERLKNALDLPPLNPRPPLPRKAYDALLSHFRKSLPATTTRARRRVEPVEPTEVDAAFEEEVADMCAELGANPNAAQYILEGLKMTGHRHSERYSLTTALALVVFEQMAIPGQEIKIGGTSWVRGDNSGSKITKKINTINAALGGKTTMADVTNWLKKWMMESTKEHQEWRRSIPDGVGVVPVRERRENAWRRDRMLQPRVDYLTEDRVEAFERWRADVLRRCDDIDGGRA